VGQDIKLKGRTDLNSWLSRRSRGCAEGGISRDPGDFGVNHHIRSVCDRLAGRAMSAIAPSIFDRTEPNFQTGYSPDE